MAIKKSIKKIAKALSFDGVEVESSRHLANLKAIDPLKIFYKTIDSKIYNEDYEVPIRIFLTKEKVAEGFKTLLFFHGGGWATENLDTYERVCARMAEATNHVVIAVEYRLAPEYKFPIGLEDCYQAAKAIFTKHFVLNVDPENITLVGDSAGGNITCALSLMARDRGEFSPTRQILIYPAVNSDYSQNSEFASVKENGSEYVLTAGKMRDYIELYVRSEEDKNNKYLAPIKETDFSNQPRTLVLSAEFDPLRDEGEEYGRRLRVAGNDVEIHRIKDVLHGFFALGINHEKVQESFSLMNQFLQEDE